MAEQDLTPVTSGTSQDGYRPVDDLAAPDWSQPADPAGLASTSPAAGTGGDAAPKARTAALGTAPKAPLDATAEDVATDATLSLSDEPATSSALTPLDPVAPSSPAGTTKMSAPPASREALLQSGGSPEASIQAGPTSTESGLAKMPQPTSQDGQPLAAAGDETVLSASSSTSLRTFATLAASATASNAIVLENQKAGNPPSEWELNNGPSSSIEGFTTDISYNVGAIVNFKINTSASKYRIDIYRLGYYGGMGARKVGSVQHNAASAIVQPAPLRDAGTGLVDAGNWQVSDSWDMPDDLVSGVYIAKLVREDGVTGENHIPFIVRNDASTSDIVFQTADTTWQAYNGWGGANLYGGNGPGADSAPGRAFKVSYNRPITTREGGGYLSGPWDFVFGAEYPALRWMEQNGYDVSYISGVDADRYGNLLRNHKIYVSSGHDEYWSGNQRANVEAARDAGVNLAFLGGNDVYWKTRWEGSIAPDGTDHRTLVTYKETRAGGKIDPSKEWTGTWRDLSADPAGGAKPENALIGTMFQVDSYRSDTMTIPYEQAQLRFWRNTAVAGTAPGGSASLVPNLLGYEWNIAPDNGFDPNGLVRLSTTTLNVDTMLLDYGTTVGQGTATHNLTLYRAPSGAMVFSSGTVYWTWGLDDNHDAAPTPTDPSVQQAMVNLFADMGVQPQTLQASLVLATGSTDRTAPVSRITTPAGGTTVQAGKLVTLTGTVSDVGGKAAAVEISADNGKTWWTADKTGSSWSYTWRTPSAGTYSILSRAVDDSLNMETPSQGLTLTVAPSNRVTLFDTGEGPPPFPTELPLTPATTCCNVCVVHVFGPTELGVKFLSSSSGTISSIRFYKNDGNTGTHVGNLWTSDGTLLASATFRAETASGWQQVDFATPVAIAANTTYVASYHTTTGVFLASPVSYFSVAHTSGPLTALASAWPNGPNGLIAYGPAGTFPTGVPQGSANYWVDVAFNPYTSAGNQAPTAAADSGFLTSRGTVVQIAAATLLANDTDPNGDPLGIASVGAGSHGTASYNPTTRLVTFTPEAGYTGPASFTYTATDGRGGTSNAQVGIDVGQTSTTVGLFSANDVPAIASTNETGSIELGLRFTAQSNGSITGLRFFKGAQNTGTHVGHLWSATGTLLATATFTAETASGWQQVTFASPVSVTAGSTYVASYHTTTGFYSSSPGYFSSGYSSGPLSVAAGGGGVFTYGASAFPTNSFNAANYWVDVLFNPTPNNNPVAGADGGFITSEGTSLTIAASALLANDSDVDGNPLTLGSVTAGSGGTVAYDATSKLITFTPTAGATGPASFSYTVTDGLGGTATAQVGINVGQTPTLTFFGVGDLPANASTNDPGGIELGLRFTAQSNGSITGLRFFKGVQNTGTHVGHLWSSTGALLASATFTAETGSGWQQVTFASPVSVTAGSTYVASYHTTTGFYSSSPGYFSSGYSSGPLSVAAGGGGVFTYGASAFPTNSFNAANYWVDVLFNPAPNTTPVAGADGGFITSEGTSLTIAASTLLANDSDVDGDTLAIGSVTAGSGGTVAYDSVSQLITFTPTAGTTGPAGFSYTVTDGRNGTATAQVGIEIGQTPTLTFFGVGDLPANASTNDPGGIELGLRFTAQANGSITGLRFFKGAQNTGTHVGHLWSSTGTLLASATFTAETGSGWQQVTFASPVSVTAGSTYVASYRTDTGFYASSPGYFSSGYSSGPLSVAPSGGVFAYSAGTFPTNSFNATNYWVDVVYNPAPPAANRAPVAVADSGITAFKGESLTIAASTLLANDTDVDGDTLTIGSVTAGSGGTVAYDTTSKLITFTPSAGAMGPADFSYTVADGRGGTATAQVDLDVAYALFGANATPTIASADDSSPIELGVRFTAQSNGSITGLRFFKGAQNTGTHVGHLWSSTGTLLASATFTAETASGWQQVALANPVAVTAGSTYVASYHTNTGHYSASPGYFSAAHENGPLIAPAGNNGLFAYGAVGSFPTNSYNATNYGVDVVFRGQLAA